jgi:hypothetical protein
MEDLIPKLFILTAEASIVLFLILVVIIIFNSKAKRRDVKAVNKLVKNYIDSKEERLATIKSHLKSISYSGDIDTQAAKLYDQEKANIKEFVTLYLKRDTYRLLDYAENLLEADDLFLKTSGSAIGVPEESPPQLSSSEETANAAILAREQEEMNEAHLKELSELRLKNTELNEHLFEALETITALMTEHGKKTGQEVEMNAQRILEAIIYLRDTRLGKEDDPTSFAPPANDGHDEVDTSWSSELTDNDATLDDSPAVNLGISDELNTDLDKLDENDTVSKSSAPQSIDLSDDDLNEETQPAASDPWAEALEEQAAAESGSNEGSPAGNEEESDPWADALAEQAEAEAKEETQSKQAATEQQAEEDPWADALAEQASAEAGQETEEDPWAAALAEQEKSEQK